MTTVKAEPWFTLKLGSWACLCVSGETMTVVPPEEFKLSAPANSTFVRPESVLRGRTSKTGSIVSNAASEVSFVSAAARRRISRANSCVSNAASDVSAYSTVTFRQRPSWLPELDGEDLGDIDSGDDGEELPTLLKQPSVRRFWSTISQAEQLSEGSMVEAKKVPLSARKLRVTFNSDSKPDFSGRWVLSSIEGDFDAFLADIGTKWMLRKMARSVGYGVGRSVQDISLDGDEFIVVSEGGPTITKLVLHIGGGEEQSIGLDGDPVMVLARWEGQALWMESRRMDGTKLPPTRRYLDGEEMVVENSTSSGLMVRRLFTKE
jgi:hypothetical protein